ncbi:uncharacterized protein LOC122663976 [Telopea speciosissima]|uniref:uncharacterized protein LOC122663976 n=1 Tax=Telopea speciosissima TaxID=54955 RepID=UPI001CC6A87D|nr:uncharacterized protein LOC122663976 [Telopea speciosissima]
METDQCIEACGLDRISLGISSDSLLDSLFTQKLCSPLCYDNCPNIVDLYFNLAAGEGNPPIPDLYFNLAATQGVFLPQLCEAQGANARRKMSEIRSSGFVKPAPQSDGPPMKFVVLTAIAPK